MLETRRQTKLGNSSERLTVSKMLKLALPKALAKPEQATTERRFTISRPQAMPVVPSAQSCLQTLEKRLGRAAYVMKSASGNLEVKYLKLSRHQLETAFSDLQVVEPVHATGLDWGCLHTGCWQYIGTDFRVRFRLRRFKHEVLIHIDTKFRTDEEIAEADAEAAAREQERLEKEAERAAKRTEQEATVAAPGTALRLKSRRSK